MKYYLVFINITDSFRAKIKGFGGMSTPFDWQYDKELDRWMALYAWTTDKKLMKIFKNQRNKDIFIYKKVDSFEDIEAFVHEEVNLKLKKYEFRSGKNGITELLVTTSFEYTTATDEGFIVETFLKDPYIPDPLLFKRDIFNLLDKIGYSYMFYNYSCAVLPFDESEYDPESTYTTESDYFQELEMRQDTFWDNYSFLDHENMRYINEIGTYGNAVEINEFNSFIQLFGLLFN